MKQLDGWLKLCRCLNLFDITTTFRYLENVTQSILSSLRIFQNFGSTPLSRSTRFFLFFSNYRFGYNNFFRLKILIVQIILNMNSTILSLKQKLEKLKLWIEAPRLYLTEEIDSLKNDIESEKSWNGRQTKRPQRSTRPIGRSAWPCCQL